MKLKHLISAIVIFSTFCSTAQSPFATGTLKGKPVSKLKSEFCNQNILSWDQIIEAYPVPGANMYRFKVVDVITGVNEIIETPIPSFSLNQLTIALVPNNPLTVSVAHKVGTHWFPYGPECTIKPTFVETWCGFDPILGQTLQDPSLQPILYQQIEEILNEVEFNQSQMTQKAPYIYTIPVVFHIIDNGPISGADFVTNSDVLDQLELLNDAFENELLSSNLAATDVQIRFCLAKQIVDEFGNILATETGWGPYWNGYDGGEPVMHGITRTTSSISDNHVIDDDITNPNGMVALADLISFPYDKYLNIWVVNSITDETGTGSILGYSPYPILSIASTLTPEDQGLLDGAVVRADGFIGGSHPTMNTGKVLVHEVGHYLKLYHTWTDACHNTSDCATMGDFICDTPPQVAPDWNGCTSGLNTCDPDPDPIDNHMSYSQEFCRNTFTMDQKNRIYAIISLYRSNLVSTDNIALTVPDCIDPLLLTNIFNTTPDNVCAGGSVSYTATPVPSPGTFIWNFPGGIPSSSTLTNPTVVYPNPGIYDVSLSITVGTDNVVVNELQTTYVLDCIPLASNNGNWFYGEQVGISFATGIAQNTTFFVVPPVNNISTPEAATSYSDDLGNLVFYADGNTIYNQNHAVMSGHAFGDVDGNDYSTSSGSSSHRGAIAFEDPNNVNTPGTQGYYIFHTSAQENLPVNSSNNHGLGYCHVTVNASNPLGIVDALNVRPNENYAISECVSAVSHCNGRDYWVVVQGSQNNISPILINPMTDFPGPLYSSQQDYFFSYLIDPSGVSSSPVASLKAPSAKSNSDFYTTYKFSPDGNIFAVITKHIDNSYDVFFYQFDKSFGNLTYLSNFDIPFSSPHPYEYRDLEFSPDGNVFYLLTQGGLYQVDISNVLTSTSGFAYTYSDLDGLQHNAMELGPDGRIYITRNNGTTKMSVINFPNELNTISWSNECGLNIEGFTYAYSRFNNLSFQNQVRNIDNSGGGFTYSQQNCTEFEFIPNICGSSYLWDFGGLGTSSDYIPSFIFPGEGSYVVTLNVDGNVSAETITIDVPDASIIGNPIIPCDNENPVDFFANPGGDYVYNWTLVGGLPSNSSNSSISLVLTDPYADLTLTVTDPATGCFSTVTTHIVSGCCLGSYQVEHPFKMNSSTPGRSEGFDVELDELQDLVYYGGNFSADMSIDTYSLTCTSPKENFMMQLNEDNCLGWLQQYPIYISTQPLSVIENYVLKTRPIRIRTTSTGEIFMANQVYGHSYISSIDPLNGNQTILFSLFNNSIPGSSSNIITDFVVDEANSRIVFVATTNAATIDFSPEYFGPPLSRVFVGAIDFSGAPISYNFLTGDVTPVSCSKQICMQPSGDFYIGIQENINNSHLYELSSSFVQSGSPFATLTAGTALEIAEMAYSDVTNQIALIGLRRGNISSPSALPMISSGPYEAFLMSYNIGTSTVNLEALQKSFDFTYPGVDIVSGNLVYSYGDQTNTDLIFGSWDPITDVNNILNQANYGFAPSIKAGAIEYSNSQNVLFSNGAFFESLDFDGTVLYANGTPPVATTFYGTKIEYTTGDFIAMPIYQDESGSISVQPYNTKQGTLGEENQSLFDFEILIYPNPNNGRFKIQFTNKELLDGSMLTIRNVHGEIIYSSVYNSDINEGYIQLEDIATGIYLVSVLTENTEFKARMVISN